MIVTDTKAPSKKNQKKQKKTYGSVRRKANHMIKIHMTSVADLYFTLALWTTIPSLETTRNQARKNVQETQDLVYREFDLPENQGGCGGSWCQFESESINWKNQTIT